MPGVLNSDFQCGFIREVGKMAFFMDPDLITFNEDDTDLEDLANSILMGPSTSSQSSGSQSGEIDSDIELPDNEQTVDLIKYLDCQDLDVGPNLARIKCDGECSHSHCKDTPDKYVKYRVSAQQDPFMGVFHTREDYPPVSSFSNGSRGLLEQMISPLELEEEDFQKYVQQQQIQEQRRFVAWHTPKTDDADLSLLTKTSDGLDLSLDPIYADDEPEPEDISFPNTPSPSSRSGDESDVDIETITDAPRAADACGYATQDSSPAMSPSASPGPLQNLRSGSLLTILSKASTSRQSSQSSSSSKSGLSSYGVSSNISLAENLMSGRSTSLLGMKRKLAKEKKCVSRQQSQPAYTHVLCNSNSVNFHDYAMSPGACNQPSTSAASASTETGRPTVLSKRIYKRKQLALDASDKEKQHHHNQLERNRRQKLADLFIDLRDEVPKIAGQVKASKVVILTESTDYIRDLQRIERRQQDEISHHIQRRDMLRKQLRQLQAQSSSSVK